MALRASTCVLCCDPGVGSIPGCPKQATAFKTPPLKTSTVGQSINTACPPPWVYPHTKSNRQMSRSQLKTPPGAVPLVPYVQMSKTRPAGDFTSPGGTASSTSQPSFSPHSTVQS